jgi:hypothetical protein
MGLLVLTVIVIYVFEYTILLVVAMVTRDGEICLLVIGNPLILPSRSTKYPIPIPLYVDICIL